MRMENAPIAGAEERIESDARDVWTLASQLQSRRLLRGLYGGKKNPARATKTPCIKTWRVTRTGAWTVSGRTATGQLDFASAWADSRPQAIAEDIAPIMQSLNIAFPAKALTLPAQAMVQLLRPV